jgi:hypothetical protein
VGTGREEATKWLKAFSSNRDIRLVSIRLTRVDASIEYRAMAKLFRQLVGEKQFDNPRWG